MKRFLNPFFQKKIEAGSLTLSEPLESEQTPCNGCMEEGVNTDRK